MFDSNNIIKAFENQQQIQTKALSWKEFLLMLEGLKRTRYLLKEK